MVLLPGTGKEKKLKISDDKPGEFCYNCSVEALKQNGDYSSPLSNE